jgi:hypothetical protein
MRRLLALCGLLGCSFDPNDAPIASVDAPPPDEVCTTFSEQLDTCALPAAGPLELSGMLAFDTNTGRLFRGATPIAVDTATLMTPAGEIKAILASSVVITADTVLRADGSRPFAIIATDAIMLEREAVIDVSSGGAGARRECQNGANTGANRDGGAGGGGGGGFGGPGGTGGSGDDDGETPSAGGAGGLAITLPSGTLGGCAGAAGGDDNNNRGGAGGAGGGAVYLVAARRIDLAASSGIHAGGAGGRGGEQSGIFLGDAGGGGGGSGGMIILEAPIVASSGTLAANGGGGGEGSGNIASGEAGAAGELGTTRATGGSGGSSDGSDGGNGGARATRDGDPVSETLDGGGGGGGGGAGFVRIVSPAPDLNAAVSPPPS